MRESRPDEIPRGWRPYRAAFALFPCSDGWAACVVADRRVDGDLVADGGFPQPNDARVAWQTLAPLPSFSPFEPLSRYAPTRRLGAPASCGDLAAAEAPAIVGLLTDDEIRCLSIELEAETRLARRDRISRLLLANAYASGDDEWVRLLARHLAEIDDTDPDLAYKYALHLRRQGPEQAEAAIRWAERALEHRTRWSGETQERRVSALYRLRAAAAQDLWCPGSRCSPGSVS